MTQSESDIVDWLRSRAIVGDDRDPHWRAADEIERLRAERPGWAEEKKELQEAIHELQEDLMKATGGTMPSKRNAVHAMGWAEAIEAAAKVADDMAENRRRIESRQGAYAASFIADRIRALHPSVAEGRCGEKI